MIGRRDVFKLLLAIPAIGSAAAIEPQPKTDAYDIFVYALRAVCADPTEYNILVVKWLLPSKELGVERLRFNVFRCRYTTKIHCSYIRDGVPHVWRNLRHQMISR